MIEWWVKWSHSVNGAGHVSAKKGRLIKVGYNRYSATSSSKVPPISEEHHKLRLSSHSMCLWEALQVQSIKIIKWRDFKTEMGSSYLIMIHKRTFSNSNFLVFIFNCFSSSQNCNYFRILKYKNNTKWNKTMFLRKY